MTVESFRKDKYLRATGYNFYVWGAVNLLVTWPLWSALAGKPWPSWLALLFPVGLIATGVVLMGQNDNRVEKMWGEPSAQPMVEAGAFWGPTLLIAWVLTIVFVVRGPIAYVQPVWLLLVGAAYLTWGTFGVREFRWFGGVLIGAGALAGLAVHPERIPPGLPSRAALIVWVVFMSILWIPFGAYINRKYVHPPSGGSAG
jgi:hypothetical protein